MSVSKTSSATTTRSRGSSSAARHESSVVLPDPGAPATRIERPLRTHAWRNRAAVWSSICRWMSSCSDRCRTPENLRMLTRRWPSRPTSECTMWIRAPLSSWASWRPSAGIQLAVRPAGVVQDLGQDPHHVVVVVEHLVVVAARARVPFGEDRRGPVDHDFPHVGVGEERLQGAVAGEVAQRPIDGGLGVGDVDPAPTCGTPPATAPPGGRAGRAAPPGRRAAMSRLRDLACSWTARSTARNGEIQSASTVRLMGQVAPSTGPAVRYRAKNTHAHRGRSRGLLC